MKHNDAVIRQYCRAVGKRLPLPAAQRRQRLTGLREEWTEPACVWTMRAGSLFTGIHRIPSACPVGADT